MYCNKSELLVAWQKILIVINYVSKNATARENLKKTSNNKPIFNLVNGSIVMSKITRVS